ncbi:hypothetical protein ABW19_dt0204820 [Dactylella cylindrospora]|nr:hypothetical protein ABW19_dt0204820 [Dactylella cylindrospora]
MSQPENSNSSSASQSDAEHWSAFDAAQKYSQNEIHHVRRMGLASNFHNEEATGNALGTVNEERLEKGMFNLAVGSRYQEHVCAEDFYNQPREVHESVVILDSATIPHEVVEGAVLEGKPATGSGSYKVESGVTWASSRLSGNGPPQDQPNDETPKTFKDQSLSNAELYQSEIETASDAVVTQVARPDKNSSNSHGATPSVSEPSPGSESNPLMTNVQSEGSKIRRQIQSVEGRQVLIDLFDLANVPDNRSFVLEILEQFISERESLWERMENQGFDRIKYEDSGDDNHFFQKSFTDFAVKAIRTNDLELAAKYLRKAEDIASRQEQNGSPEEISYHRTAIRIEYIEIKIYQRFVALMLDKNTTITTNTEPDEMFATTSANSWTLTSMLQFKFLYAMISGTMDHRLDVILRLSNFDIPTSLNQDDKEAIEDMRAVELLRYGAEITMGNASRLPDAQKSAAGVTSRTLYQLFEVGHKNIILQNLRKLYDYRDHITTASAPSLGSNQSPRGPDSQDTSAALPNEPLAILSESYAQCDEISVQSQDIRSRSVRRISPPRAQTGTIGLELPYGEPAERKVRAGLNDLNHAPDPLSADEAPDDDIQVVHPELDQPFRHSDSCSTAEIEACQEFKFACRQVQNLEQSVARLASLKLINYIKGARTHKPWTPLIECICNQRWEAAKLLINLGAAMNLGYPFHTALSRHAMSDSRIRCQKLINRGLIDTKGVPIEDFFWTESVGLVKFMLEKWKDLDLNVPGYATTDQEWQIETYALHLAALDRNSTLLVRILIERGAGWKWDKNGETPLNYARRAGNKETIRCLEKLEEEYMAREKEREKELIGRH